MRPIRWTLRIRFRRPGRGRFRLIAKPDARSVAVFHADARRAVATLAGARGNPGKLPRLPIGRSTLAAALAIVFLAGIATAIFGSRGVLDVARSREELREIEAQVAARMESVAALRREVQRLKSDRLATERIARESLGYVRPGEITFLLPREGGTSRVAQDAGRGRPAGR